MTDKSTELFRKAIYDIKPDDYMKTRLEAKVMATENKKSKTPLVKKVATVSLAFAVLITSVGGAYAMREKKNDTKFTDSFSIVAYAASDNGERKKLDFDGSKLKTNIKIKLSMEKNNLDSKKKLATVALSGGMSFDIDATDIDTVTFESKSSTFDCWNQPLINELQRKGEFYDYTLPLTEAQGSSCMEKYEKKVAVEDIVNELISTTDCSSYLPEKFNPYDYHIIFDSASDERAMISINFISYKRFNNFHLEEKNKLKINLYDKNDKIENIFYNCNNAITTLLENPDMPYDELPVDDIYITVKFKSGDQASKHILSGFDKRGYLWIEEVKS